MVANTKSTAVTALDATPSKSNPLHLANARVYESIGTVEVAAADADNSVYRFCRVFSGWRISTIELLNDAIASGTDFNFGLWDTAENGGAVVAENCYADAVSMASARVAPLDITFESGGKDVANIEKRVYQDAGLSADPGKWYDLCAIGITVGTAAGTLSVRVRYVGPA